VSSQEAARGTRSKCTTGEVSDRSKQTIRSRDRESGIRSAQSNYDAAVALKSLEEQVNTQKAELHYYGVRSR
jgi:hypothetical protein